MTEDCSAFGLPEYLSGEQLPLVLQVKPTETRALVAAWMSQGRIGHEWWRSVNETIRRQIQHAAKNPESWRDR